MQNMTNNLDGWNDTQIQTNVVTIVFINGQRQENGNVTITNVPSNNNPKKKKKMLSVGPCLVEHT